MNDSRRSSASRLSWRLCSERRATHSVAVANCPRCTARHARIESHREVRFAGPGRAEKDHVLASVEEVELPEMLNDRLLDAALEGEVELLQGFAGREPGG